MAKAGWRCGCLAWPRGSLECNSEFAQDKASGFSRRVMDIGRARRWLGYEPHVSLRVGLEETWAWYQRHRDEHLAKVNYFREHANASQDD